MENNKTFTITFTKQNGESTTRKAQWNDKCKYWFSKAGIMLMTYFDVDQNGYRTASDSWTIKK